MTQEYQSLPKGIGRKITLAFVRMTAYIAIPAFLTSKITDAIANSVDISVKAIHPWVIVGAFVITWTCIILDYKFLMKSRVDVVSTKKI